MVELMLYGSENPKYLDKIYSFLENAEVFISIGTSNNVYPAAGFIDFSLQLEKKYFFTNLILERLINHHF